MSTSQSRYLGSNLECASGFHRHSQCGTQGKASLRGLSPLYLSGRVPPLPTLPAQGRPPWRGKAAAGLCPHSCCPSAVWCSHPEAEDEPSYSYIHSEINLTESELGRTTELSMALLKLLKQTHGILLIFRVSFKTIKLLKMLLSGVGNSRSGVSEGPSVSEVRFSAGQTPRCAYA